MPNPTSPAPDAGKPCAWCGHPEADHDKDEGCDGGCGCIEYADSFFAASVEIDPPAAPSEGAPEPWSPRYEAFLRETAERYEESRDGLRVLEAYREARRRLSEVEAEREAWEAFADHLTHCRECAETHYTNCFDGVRLHPRSSGVPDA